MKGRMRGREGEREGERGREGGREGEARRGRGDEQQRNEVIKGCNKEMYTRLYMKENTQSS